MLLINASLLFKYLHIFQLKDYNFKRYLKFFKYKLIFPIILILAFYIELIFNNLFVIISFNILSSICEIGLSLHLTANNKTPLKQTSRIKRLCLISTFLIIFPCFFKFGGLISIFFTFFAPIFANFLNFYDFFKNKKYIKLAQKKLENSKANIIAITGSNGKTSVKLILNKMLSDFFVLASPKSYNTPLGIAKFINENDISNCDYLILEYGARNKGDIKKMCKLFGADYGIITTVAPQHLETFKNINNVYKTKSELSNYLQTKPCVFNLDNIYTYKMCSNKPGTKIGVSIYCKTDTYCTELKIKNNKTYFNLCINNNHYSISCKLLGRHNVTNILLASSLAKYLGVSDEYILKSIKNLDYAPHRLQLIKSRIKILDDSYNCSILSAKEALFVLQNLKGKKVVATPGIIEGGKKEKFLNYNLGKMLSVCDEVIIIGNHNKNAIKQGLDEKNFKNVVFCNNLEDAKKQFLKLNNNDCLLLLNDLPDDYK